MINQKGFTLIETIIYIALFAIIIGGGMVAAYQIIQATEASNNHITLQEEANFLLRKINWALSQPAIGFGIGSSVLTVSSSPQLKFDFNSQNLQLTKGLDTPVILNSSAVTVSNLSFCNTTCTLPITSNGVTTSFTLTTMQSGRPASQSFSTTKYLRR